MASARRLRFTQYGDRITEPPFDVNDPEVQRACRAVARLLLDEAGEEETRRTILAIMIAATGDEPD